MKPSPQPPADFATVLAAELAAIQKRRQALFPDMKPLPSADPLHPGAFTEAHRVRPLGVCFSGGGIRSATFNLGVLQGLAELGLIPYIDYLSTVSGGGYIGGWLHGIIRNKHQGDPVNAQGELHPRRVPGDPDRDPITFLRKYSNYLAPQLGLFSPDFWTIASVWLRNMTLNLAILIPFLMAVVLAVILTGDIKNNYAGNNRFETATALFIATAAGFVTTIVVGVNLRQIVFVQFPEMRRHFRLPDLSGRFVVGAAAACVMLSCYILGAFEFKSYIPYAGVIIFFLFAALQTVGGFRVCYRKRHDGASGWHHLIGIPLLCSVVTTSLLWTVSQMISAWNQPDSEWARDAFGPPLILLVWFAGATLQVGLMGSDFPDAAREWLARFNATLSIAMAGWMGLYILAVFGPYWLAWATLKWAPAAVVFLAAWLGSAISGYLTGKSSKTVGQPKEDADVPTRAMDLAAQAAPVVFLAGFLLFISFGVHVLLRTLSHFEGCSPAPLRNLPDWLVWLSPIEHDYWCFLSYGNAWLLPPLLMLLLLCLMIILVLPLRVNINEFSMHHFYKNRLVRCYLGAGRAADRKPNRLTGFDPYDDFALAALTPDNPLCPYYGPYPIVNCALNLNTGSELAKQERRGASFIFTPRYCGFDPPHSREDRMETSRVQDLNVEGYRATRGYMEPAGPALGTAIGISGAAANPNSGYHTSAPLAFLMTILNARLGWWVGNPRRDEPSTRPGPKNALISLLSELFAQSNGRSRYVNISDGGHFENLGLYELVRRRCRYIIVCDSEADPKLTFEGLGSAIRKCRADFGVEINVDPGAVHRVDGRSRSHCVVGTVVYPEPETGYPADACGREQVPYTAYSRTLGWILYLKSSLTGDEPEDVEQYQTGHPTFPHESTADQFFSESQFESYRQLGLHVMRTTFENVTRPVLLTDQRSMLELFQDLCRKWYPAPALAGGALTEQYSAFLRRMSEDPELAFLDGQLFRGMPAQEPPEPTPRKAVYFCMELIQLMEDVFFELKFEHRSERENPLYTGWIEVFTVWANSRAILEAWSIARNGFNPIFREFFENLKTAD